MKSNPYQDNAVATFIVEVSSARRTAVSRTAEALAPAPGVRFLQSILDVAPALSQSTAPALLAA